MATNISSMARRGVPTMHRLCQRGDASPSTASKCLCRGLPAVLSACPRTRRLSVVERPALPAPQHRGEFGDEHTKVRCRTAHGELL